MFGVIMRLWAAKRIEFRDESGGIFRATYLPQSFIGAGPGGVNGPSSTANPASQRLSGRSKRTSL